MPMLLAVNTPPAAAARLRSNGQQALEVAGYGLSGLAALAVVPALFVAIDHAVVVRWTNRILDLLELL